MTAAASPSDKADNHDENRDSACMAEEAIEGGAKNAWQEAVIDKLPPLM